MNSFFNLKILANGEITKSNTTNKETVVYIQDETPYSILLENNSNIITDVFLKIDGKKMGTYRLIPNEKYELNRPIRRKKELIFLKKKEEYKKDGLFTENNKELGRIEAEFKTGVINIKNKEVCKKKVFRPENEGYIPEYMNIYKKPLPYDCVMEEKQNMEKQNIDECCVPIECSVPIYNDDIIENVIEYNNNHKDSSNGFTVYGDEIGNKFKTFHQLLYDGNSTTIKLLLQCKKSYQKL